MGERKFGMMKFSWEWNGKLELFLLFDSFPWELSSFKVVTRSSRSNFYALNADDVFANGEWAGVFESDNDLDGKVFGMERGMDG